VLDLVVSYTPAVVRSESGGVFTPLPHVFACSFRLVRKYFRTPTSSVATGIDQGTFFSRVLNDLQDTRPSRDQRMSNPVATCLFGKYRHNLT
jgi:hypothetical protein